MLLLDHTDTGDIMTLEMFSRIRTTIEGLNAATVPIRGALPHRYFRLLWCTEMYYPRSPRKRQYSLGKGCLGLGAGLLLKETSQCTNGGETPLAAYAALVLK